MELARVSEARTRALRDPQWPAQVRYHSARGHPDPIVVEAPKRTLTAQESTHASDSFDHAPQW